MDVKAEKIIIAEQQCKAQLAQNMRLPRPERNAANNAAIATYLQARRDAETK